VVKLIDFGIAKASAAGMQTLSGTIKGKFGYMAPEYLAGKIDARADLFAVGIMGHELLTGKPLFQGRDDMDTLYRVRSMPIRPPSEDNPDIPHEIDAIVMTALERDPDARWQRASAMRIALTTEMKRLGLTMLDQQVVEWVEATFGQHQFDVDSQPAATRVLQPKQETASIVIERGEDPTDLLKTSLRDSSRAAPGARRATRASDVPLPLPAPTTGQLPVAPQALVPAPERLRPSSSQPPLTPHSSSPPLSGARTRPNLKQPQRTLHVEADDVLDEVAVAAEAGRTPEVIVKQMGNLTIFVLLLLAAAAAGAVVYFGLPYLQP